MHLFSFSNNFLTFLVIVSLILNSFGFLNKHNEPETQVNEPPDPFEMLMGDPSPILESAPDFEELQNRVKETEAPEKEYPQIKMELTPALFIPGEPFTVTWNLSGLDAYEKGVSAEVFLSIIPNQEVELLTDQMLPPGTEVVAEEDGSTQLRTTIENTSGQIFWNLNVQRAPVDEQQYVSIALMDGQKIITSQAVALKTTGQLITLDKGGMISSQNERVNLTIPTKAMDENVYVDISYPSPHTNPSYSLTGNAIEVLAVGEKSKQNIHQFNSDLTIQMKYNDEDLKRWTAEELTIYYFNEADNDWYPLETTVDTKNRTLTAKVDHLTIFDYKSSSWQASRLPSVDEFQVADFTGAATYAVDFWVPPAPGGLEPKLSLQYNSQVIDDSVVFTQASWVGMGWSLDTGAIERNMHGTTSNLNDDTFEFKLNGISSLLLPIGIDGSITTYATSEQSYWTITFNSLTNIWEAWDQQGNYYKFSHTAKTHTTQTCTSSAGNLNLTWRWSLTEVKDKFNNTLTYTYTSETKSGSCANVVAVYPYSIVWPNNRYQVVFHRENRSDYQLSWTENASRLNFSKQRLDKIIINHSPDGTTWSPIRQYDFTYPSTGTNNIYPNFEWSANGFTSTLIGLQEKNGNGTSALPATQFTYADKMHLTKVNNGYGGEVTINYSRWTYLDDENDDLRSLYINFGTGTNDECQYNGTAYTSWSVYNGYGSVKCEAHMLQLDKRTSSIAIAQHQFPEFIIKPGGQYQVAVFARSITGNSSLEYGFREGQAQSDIQSSCNINETINVCEASLEMPVEFNPIGSKLLLESPWA